MIIEQQHDMIQAEAGKGSAPRKTQDQKKYADNWDLIFGKKKEPTPTQQNKIQ